ncbi:MAG: DUF1634 domain-containing protein [Bacteroidetes bacterium]|nr:DUF1634 domain-containing protein [Bacteroidota bacterium]
MSNHREHIVSRTLMAGITVSGALMLVGFALYAAQPSWYDVPIPVANFAWLGELAASTIPTILLNPFVSLYAGIFALMLTPILRLFITGWTFLVERDWHYVGITVIVLTVIGISIGFSIVH